MPTQFSFRRTQTVSVLMADEGEEFEGEPVHWETPEAQREAALDWASGAFLDEDYCEDFMGATVSDWEDWGPPEKRQPSDEPVGGQD